ncbi:MAG TPA: SpoIID/LytB domain-containing protein [Gemmatimonadales bacterium]|jgi:stage II sporulation protein D|nr:SpoIID/LytB domain-containing protein [Gemmatimonadales bacterium]
MRRWTRRALASLTLLWAAACPRPPGRPAPAGEPELRVALAVGAETASLGGDGEMFVTDDGTGQPVGSIPAGVRWTAVPDSGSGKLRLVKPDGTSTEPHRGVAAVNVTEDRFAMANGRRYRGRIHVIASRAGMTLVNRVGIEGYVAGVVGPEIGARRPNEEAAVLAQAVVSRSFALRNRGRWESLGFDAYADVRDQVYVGVAAETPQVWAAVRRTAGQVLRYRGEIIDAYFHSTCGFSTAGVEEAFGTARGRPYLRPVSDATGRGGDHYYCDISPRFRWREEWDGPKLRAILSRTLPTVMPLGGDGLQPITGVEVSRLTRSGRVGELRIVFARGDVRIPATNVRTVLRPDADRMLSSTAFQVTVTKDGGQVSRLVAAGAGAGHGVGMCQWGAVGRARAGQDYRRILSTYFPGTTLDRIY